MWVGIVLTGLAVGGLLLFTDKLASVVTRAAAQKEQESLKQKSFGRSASAAAAAAVAAVAASGADGGNDSRGCMVGDAPWSNTVVATPADGKAGREGDVHGVGRYLLGLNRSFKRLGSNGSNNTALSKQLDSTVGAQALESPFAMGQDIEGPLPEILVSDMSQPLQKVPSGEALPSFDQDVSLTQQTSGLLQSSSRSRWREGEGRRSLRRSGSSRRVMKEGVESQGVLDGGSKLGRMSQQFGVSKGQRLATMRDIGKGAADGRLCNRVAMMPRY